MTPEQIDTIAQLIRTTREQQGLSTAAVAKRAGINVSSLWRIEEGQRANPKAEVLQAIGHALGIPTSDLFAAAGWVPRTELPTIRPYLRTKYGELPADAVAEIEAHFDDIARKHGISFDRSSGPMRGEDE
ncbi:helix-turn-helix domain-containing protein [Antrihabitans sp. NCIMB 15449]|uniref:Helix-turn-helix domain-containing protein n=1 Tax=Antrihabitans spumae TaxID=3373370 RepID=A0ABW7JIQ9_9NOCA